MKPSALITILASAGLLVAAPAIAAAAPPMNAQDGMFVRQAAQGGMAEVKLAQLALSKSTTPAVMSFAHHMIHDHTQANAQLMSIAQSQGIALPAGVGAKNERLMAHLQSDQGAAFDTTYLKSQLPAHEKMLRLFRQEAADGQDPALVAFAKQTIPTIEQHMRYDRRDLASIGASVGMMR